MRKILISVVVGLMLILLIFFIVKGFDKISVKGIIGIKEKDTEIEGKIEELSNEVVVSYTNAEKELKDTSNKLIDAKTEYENQATLSSSNGSSYISTLEPYDIDYLWTRLGNYAKEENVVIKIDVTAGGSSSKLYNLNFTVTGTYVGATDFIYDIENDSSLGFKIDNFKMIAGGGSEVTASFVCQDIPISVGNIESSKPTETTPTNNTTNNTNTTNAQNTTNNTSNANTSNTTNSNNTSSTGTADQYGFSDPNKSNLTSIDQVVKK